MQTTGKEIITLVLGLPNTNKSRQTCFMNDLYVYVQARYHELGQRQGQQHVQGLNADYWQIANKV